MPLSSLARWCSRQSDEVGVTTKIIDEVFNELRMDVLCDLKAPSQIEPFAEVETGAAGLVV